MKILKKPLISLSALALLSLSAIQAVAATTSSPYDVIAGNQTYTSLSPKICGLHIEKSNGGIVATYVKNPGSMGVCNMQGKTFEANCKSDANCIGDLSEQSQVSIQILEDGNFTYQVLDWDRAGMRIINSSALVKFIL